jgi:hypothetical protein
MSLVLDATGASHLSFSGPEEARAWIKRLAGRKEHPLSGASTYEVTKVGSKRYRDAYKSTWEGKQKVAYLISDRTHWRRPHSPS